VTKSTRTRPYNAAEYVQALADYPELDHYADRPPKAIALAAALRGYAEPERSMRREILAKSIAAEKRRQAQPEEPAGPDYYKLADQMFLALNHAAQVIARNGGAETLRQAISSADPLMIQVWRDQFTELAATCAALADECAPRLRRIK
jgi:hypothetical protein